MNLILTEERKGDYFTVIMFMDADSGHEIMFRLRQGHGTLKGMNTQETILSEPMRGFDGECNLSDFDNWATDHSFPLSISV